MRELTGTVAFHGNFDISTYAKIKYARSETMLQHLNIFTPVCATVCVGAKSPFFFSAYVKIL